MNKEELYGMEVRITLSMLLFFMAGLKLGGVLSISWWWVLAPLWIPIGLALLLVLATYNIKS